MLNITSATRKSCKYFGTNSAKVSKAHLRKVLMLKGVQNKVNLLSDTYFNFTDVACYTMKICYRDIDFIALSSLTTYTTMHEA